MLAITNNVDNTYYVDGTTLDGSLWAFNVAVQPVYPFAFQDGTTIRLKVYQSTTLLSTVNTTTQNDGTAYAMGYGYSRLAEQQKKIYASSLKGVITNTGQPLVGHTPPPIVNNIANTTASGAGVTYKGYEITVIFTSGAANPDTEYKVTYFRQNRTTKAYERIEGLLTLNDDGKLTAVCEYPQWDDDEHPITLQAGAPPPVEGSVTNEIAGTEMEFDRNGTTLTVALSPTSSLNNTYRYYEVAFNYTDTEGNVRTIAVPAQNSSSLTFSVSDYDSTKDATVTGAFEDSVLITGSFTNCVVSGLREYYRLTEPLNVTLTANDGNEFADTDRPVLTYKNRRNESYAIDCVVSGDKTAATFATEVLSSYGVSVYLTAGGGATPVTVIRQYGTVNYYRVTLDDLDSFAKKRFFVTTLSGESSQVQAIDLGNFVKKLKRLYCEVPAYGTDTIHCGNYDTKISVSVPRSDVLTLDFGAITLPTYNASSLDFQSEYSLYAPFVGTITIPSCWAGRSLGLKYIVNSFVCQAVCVVSVDGVDVERRQCGPATGLYYTVSNSAGAIGEDEYDIAYLSGLEPVLSVKHYTELRQPTNATVANVTLGTTEGFVMVDEHYTPPLAGVLGEESTEIANHLHSGVYMR